MKYIKINAFTFLVFLHVRGKVGLLEEKYILNSSSSFSKVCE